MNKYQKQLVKEIKNYIKDKKYTETKKAFRRIKRFLKCSIKYSWCSPCEDCDNPRCSSQFNVLAYCSDRR